MSIFQNLTSWILISDDMIIASVTKKFSMRFLKDSMK